MNEEGTTRNHPVWDVYDLHRTARLNAKYYACRLNYLERSNFWMEFALAVSASSTITSLWLWTTPLGQVSWKVFGVATAVLSIAKPLLRLTDKIRRMEKVQCGYEALDHDLYRLGLHISQGKSYTPQLQKQFLEAVNRKGLLVRERVEIRERKRIKRRCEEEVTRELSVDRFYIPKEVAGDTQQEARTAAHPAPAGPNAPPGAVSS